MTLGTQIFSSAAVKLSSRPTAKSTAARPTWRPSSTWRRRNASPIAVQSAPPAVSLAQPHDLCCRPLAADDSHQQVGPAVERNPLLIGVDGVVVGAGDTGSVAAVVAEHGLDHMRRDFKPIMHDGAHRPP